VQFVFLTKSILFENGTFLHPYDKKEATRDLTLPSFCRLVSKENRKSNITNQKKIENQI
jgi:hypothetical protein